MSPLNLNLTDLIANVDDDLPETAALAKVAEAQSRSHTLAALGDQLVSHYVAIARDDGASWAEIGDAIGVSKQAVQQRHSPQLFSRFTDLSRHAVVLAMEVVRTYRHDHVDTDHVLIGLLDEPRGLAARLMTEHAGSAEAVRAAIEPLMDPRGKKTPRGHIPFTTANKQALEAAVQASAELDNDFVGTEHLLLGLLSVDGKAKDALATLGITLETMKPRVTEAIAHLMAQPRTTTD
ncbi:MAG TPA: Clp protease N-terminal domain-containing protein [Pseudonocardiaceae bacterium]|nr:Clp protease N-terminal domain-containing protein [Pseudonocardiaceae bacterium]